MAKTAITPTRSENYPEWYQQVIKGAEMAENSPTRGNKMKANPRGFFERKKMSQRKKSERKKELDRRRRRRKKRLKARKKEQEQNRQNK